MASTTEVSHGDYTIGWITALPFEMAAASAMLDEIHDSLPVHPSDNNAYTLGKIGQHNVVIACLPLGAYGTTSTAAVATQMLSSFGSIRFSLMVGIGGGVPTKEVDIRLGDVVVGIPNDQYGGIIQYYCDKPVQGPLSLDRPPTVILSAISKLQSDHLIRGSQIPDLLSEMVEKYPKMESKFKYPGQEQDQLYEAEQLVDRTTRNTGPEIHYGLIASSDRVITDEVIRDQLARRLGVLCFESEAVGLISDFPYLMIRGICDYADSNKNKQWQHYAAATAAAFAKELLCVIPSSKVAEIPIAVSTFQSQVKNASERRRPLLQFYESNDGAVVQTAGWEATDRFGDATGFNRPDSLDTTCETVEDSSVCNEIAGYSKEQQELVEPQTVGSRDPSGSNLICPVCAKRFKRASDLR
jgi:nucleoside phosphorylase